MIHSYASRHYPTTVARDKVRSYTAYVRLLLDCKPTEDTMSLVFVQSSLLHPLVYVHGLSLFFQSTFGRFIPLFVIRYVTFAL